MAQTNYTPIILYNSGTTTNAPSASNLASGELAINYTDGKLFYKDNSSAIQIIGWKTTPTTAGGTGLTSYTAGDLPYYASGSALSKLAIGTANYVLTSSGTAPQYVAQSTLSVGSATNATNTAITDNTSSSATWYPTIVSATTGNLPQTTSSTKLSFVPSTGVLSTTGSNLSGLTASSAVATDASKNLVSVTNTGTGNNVLATTPTITTPNISGNLTFTSSNAGIVFNNSSALTNSTLNDYETGTYTVTATPLTSGSITLNASYNTATYTKIGRQVLVTGEIIVSSVSSPVGTSVNLNLPFTSSNLTQRSSYAVATMSGGVAGSATPTVYFIFSNVATMQVNVNASTITSDYRFDFSISYTANF